MCCEECQKYKMFWGFIILIFGIVWYLRETGTIILEPFWPIIAIAFGLIILIKTFTFRPEMKKKRR